MESTEPIRVVIRVTRAAEAGETVTEEREVECPADRLLETLALPWEAARPQPEPIPQTEQVREAIARALGGVLLTVTERRTAEGSREYGIRLGGSTSTDESNQVGADDWVAREPDAPDRAVHVRHRASIVMGGDDGETGADYALGGHRLTVMNQGLSVANWGNWYVIMDLHLDMHFHAG
jgi:hypothetical protein